MSTAPAPAPPSALPVARTNSLALSFQDVITVVLRMRYGTQRVPDARAFRTNVRNMIGAAVNNVRAMGYSDNASRMALYAIIAFLDETVLNSQDPAFADWARQPLQEEMFGGHVAGEAFFNNVNGLLNAPETSEVADALELHAILLLLGYRGRYALGNAGDLQGVLNRIREKITRIRGPLVLARLTDAPEVKMASQRDKWLTTLWLTAGALAVLLILLFVVYTLTLGSGVSNIHTAMIEIPAGRLVL
jgi:type VI secretion system protein ImpK